MNVARDNFLAVLDDVLNAEDRRYLPHFLEVCVELLRSLPSPESRNAFLTFDRMCAAIDMEDKGLTEFKVNIEKDPAQEDFLQGRMSGSPYSSSDPDMGPTMRDIKRKICNDCELVSLLEDDNGMELLVDGKIISLDLEVAEVFKRVWYPAHGVDPMVIVYRMRGLLGDATEEFVHGFNGSVERSESEEFNLSYLFTPDCLTVMLERLEKFDKPPTCDLDYIYPLLELFHCAVKVKSNRTKLLDPSLKALPRFISKLRLLIGAPFRPHAAQLPEKILYIVKRLYEEAVSLSDDEFKDFVDFPQVAVDLVWLLNFLHGDCNIPIGCKEEILRTVGLLTLGSHERIELVVKYFDGFSDFTRYDNNVSAEIRAEGEMMCTVMSGVTTSSFGCMVKNQFVKAGYLSRATDYLLAHAPAACRQGLTLDSDELQEFVARPGLRFSLKFLNELCRGHEASQLHVATDCVPIVHRLESVSSKEHIGSLAEGLMEILRENDVVAKKVCRSTTIVDWLQNPLCIRSCRLCLQVEEARLETKRRKKQIAMEVRKKQLRRLGMQLTDSGAIVICSDRLKEFTEVAKESELNCVICRESLIGNPKKPIGLYTFSKVVDIEPYEQSAVKSKSIFTVSYLNAIHYDCHVVAVRSATNRAEWESAMLHNASTRCNGLLPLLGPQTSDADYGSALAKHQRYVYHHTGFNDFGLRTSVHDLKFLMFRIAKGESLSTDTGGGGRGANLSFLPHLAVVCLYYITSTNAYHEHACLLEAFLAQQVCEWRQDAFHVSLTSTHIVSFYFFLTDYYYYYYYYYYY
ncbi:E3 UbLigase R4 domain containing protein [Trichuris trichiura]|uniref:E3 UbLigase R4 domain containing protein n=1 Tax=Trichuris trichiura TaxID=36087 RepID=A0A077ZBG8_TRITR|nr:E3 UbLigase R4 domain containing protein [Trichuris trichiura]